MKNLILGLCAVLSVSSFAEIALQCGPKGNDEYRVLLEIGDDASEQPKSWSMFVDGESIKNGHVAKLQLNKTDATVTVTTGNELPPFYIYYRFQFPSTCEANTFDGRLDITSVSGRGMISVQTLNCNCMED